MPDCEQAEKLADQLLAEYPGLVKRAGYGETVLFYNPTGLLPAGVYFASLKNHDGPNDQGSHLDRDGVFRVAFGLPDATYEGLFGPRPPRPGKGRVVHLEHDFAAVDRLTPHPVYAWMGWVQMLSPSARNWQEIKPYLEESHRRAVALHDKRIRSSADVSRESRGE